MASGARGRGKVDVESLERENDRGLDILSERVGLLKAATQGIKNEVDSQHVLLDDMGDSMGNTRGFLGAVNDKFKVVMNGKGNRSMAFTVAGIVGVFIVLWWLTQK